MILPWLATAEAASWNRLQRAAAEGRVRPLVRALDGRHVYLREVAARGLARTSGSEGAREVLLAHLTDAGEAAPVRAQCAVTLAGWGVVEAVGPTLTALRTADPESRYWLAWSLHALDTPEARAELRELTADPDLYVAASAREWAP